MSSQPFPPNISFYPNQQGFHPNPYPAVPVFGTVPLTSKIGEVKPRKRTCSVAGCKNGIVQGGLCVSHGAKRRQCGFPGCTKSSKCAGMCSKHGPPRKPCDTEGCNSLSVRGGKCKLHAVPTVTCAIEGCTKVGAINGVCKMHHHQVNSGELALRIGTGLVPVFHHAWVPSSYMLPHMNCIPSREMYQIIASQNRLLNMAMSAGAAASSPHPSTLRNQRQSSTYLSHIARPSESTAALGYGDLFQSQSFRNFHMRLPQAQGLRHPSVEALAALGLHEQASINRPTY
ncbi:hypothetical protein HJC23_011699 [Cyclotella cryptica]|uniref:Uncharacterized protein n=1 Tax=Cyclotella cryptica TaxID=29204 RepID=A0ABD3QJX2_9STRA|eukprot:CCRYP_004819-RC/>CCRYP_004819-RC protein AED:0.04 eAED:0.04 QI:1687/1/1/1/0.5/0.33/3/189/285